MKEENPSFLLKAEHLKKYYGRGETLVKALNDISLSIYDGEFVAIIGTSGSGKTTLLNMLGGLDRPTEGTVMIDGYFLEQFDREELAAFRRQMIGFVFQSYNLVPTLSVYDNIILPIELNNEEPEEGYIRELLQMLGIEEKKDEYPLRLSGGQQQRVAIARALAARPRIILADEPTGNLDSASGNQVIHLLTQTCRELEQTMVLITHDEKIAQRADRIIRIEDGRIVDNTYEKE